MTIFFSKEGAPLHTADKLSAWLPDVQNIALEKGAAGGAEIGMSQGYQVHYPSLSGLLGDTGELLESNDVVRWRHLIASDGEAYGEIELDENQEPVALHQGPSKDGFNEAIERAKQLDGDFEASVVEIPPLYFVGLYLVRKNDELVMPYPPNASPLQNYETYRVEQVIEMLSPLARQIVNGEAGEQGVPG